MAQQKLPSRVHYRSCNLDLNLAERLVQLSSAAADERPAARSVQGYTVSVAAAAPQGGTVQETVLTQLPSDAWQLIPDILAPAILNPPLNTPAPASSSSNSNAAQPVTSPLPLHMYAVHNVFATTEIGEPLKDVDQDMKLTFRLAKPISGRASKLEPSVYPASSSQSEPPPAQDCQMQTFPPGQRVDVTLRYSPAGLRSKTPQHIAAGLWLVKAVKGYLYIHFEVKGASGKQKLTREDFKSQGTAASADQLPFGFKLPVLRTYVICSDPAATLEQIRQRQQDHHHQQQQQQQQCPQLYPSPSHWRKIPPASNKAGAHPPDKPDTLAEVVGHYLGVVHYVEIGEPEPPYSGVILQEGLFETVQKSPLDGAEASNPPPAAADAPDIWQPAAAAAAAVPHVFDQVNQVNLANMADQTDLAGLAKEADLDTSEALAAMGLPGQQAEQDVDSLDAWLDSDESNFQRYLRTWRAGSPVPQATAEAEQARPGEPSAFEAQHHHQQQLENPYPGYGSQAQPALSEQQAAGGQLGLMQQSHTTMPLEDQTCKQSTDWTHNMPQGYQQQHTRQQQQQWQNQGIPMDCLQEQQQQLTAGGPDQATVMQPPQNQPGTSAGAATQQVQHPHQPAVPQVPGMHSLAGMVVQPEHQARQPLQVAQCFGQEPLPLRCKRRHDKQVILGQREHLAYQLLEVAAGKWGSDSVPHLITALQSISDHNVAHRNTLETLSLPDMQWWSVAESWDNVNPETGKPFKLQRTVLHLLVSEVWQFGPPGQDQLLFGPNQLAVDARVQMLYHLLNYDRAGFRQGLQQLNHNSATPWFTACHYCIPEVLEFLLGLPELTENVMLKKTKRGKLYYQIISAEAAVALATANDSPAESEKATRARDRYQRLQKGMCTTLKALAERVQDRLQRQQRLGALDHSPAKRPRTALNGLAPTAAAGGAGGGLVSAATGGCTAATPAWPADVVCELQSLIFHQSWTSSHPSPKANVALLKDVVKRLFGFDVRSAEEIIAAHFSRLSAAFRTGQPFQLV